MSVRNRRAQRSCSMARLASRSENRLAGGERLWWSGLALMPGTVLSGFFCVLCDFYSFLLSFDQFRLFICSLTPKWHGGGDHVTNESFNEQVKISI